MKKFDFQLRLRPALITMAVFFIIWLLPCPVGVDPKGWKMTAIFAATITGLLTNPMPMGAVVLLALTFTVLTKTLPLTEMLSGFSNSSVWMIVMAFFISRGFAKTGLGNRIGYFFISKLGHTTLGLAYAVCFAQYVLGPATPSSTARSGGTICPLVMSLARVYGSDPALGTQRTIGSYLMFVACTANYPVCAAFLTAMAANPLAAAIAASQGVYFDWLSWAWAALVPAFVCLCMIPLSVYYLSPPEIKHSPEARQLGIDKLAEMGPMSHPEKAMLGTFLGLLVLWVGGSFFGVDATTAAFVGITFLLYCGVLNWQDILAEKGAYECLIWFSGIIFMASSLNKYGVISWAGAGVAGFVSGFSWPVALFILVLAAMYGGYCVASPTAYTGATYATFLSIILSTGAPPQISALLISQIIALQSCLTWYSGGVGPVYYGTGYIDSKEWLKLGFITSVLQIIVYLGVGAVWWKITGFY